MQHSRFWDANSRLAPGDLSAHHAFRLPTQSLIPYSVMIMQLPTRNFLQIPVTSIYFTSKLLPSAIHSQNNINPLTSISKTPNFTPTQGYISICFNTLRTGDADLRFYITTVQDGWRISAFLTRACFPCTIHLIMQYIEPVSEWYCWRMFVENWPHSELTFRHRASSI